MKSNLLHICFVLDESGSMYGSVNDVIGGFQKLIDEQKQIKDGECIVSVYRFADTVKSDFIGKPVEEVQPLEYNPGGCTAMNDGIGTAIDEIGLWLSDMDESERPSKNLIVIMTDGCENASKEYSFQDVKDRIKHQEEKYNWSFVYMGTDLTSLDDANALGIRMSSVSSRDNVVNNYGHINSYAACYRVAKNDLEIQAAQTSLALSLSEDTAEYSVANGIKVE
jgi:uncharacterized protein YegL|nr:MAG TPA: von Willebrand factor type A domain protein [Caudoviricetes sp.]